MNKRVIGALFFIAFFLFAPLSSFCQKWLTHHYTGLDGLPSSNVFDITQDTMGRVWFATRAGIACYDGVSWQNYTSSHGLPVLSFMKIRADEKGRIWALPQVGKEGIQIVFYDGLRWNPIDLLRGSYNQMGRIPSFLVIPVEQGKEADDKPTIVMGTLDAGLSRWEKGKWSSLTIDDGLPSNRVNGAAVLAGKLFVATDKGLSVITWDSGRRIVDNRWNTLLGLPSRKIRGICSEYKDHFQNRAPGSPFGSKTSRLWIYGHYWLACIDETVFQNESGDPAKYAQYVKIYDPVETRLKAKDLPVELLPDYHGGLYVGDHFELFYFNYQTQRTEMLSPDSGMVGSGANGMFIDFEKNIWVACDRGVTKISGRQLTRQFTSFQMNQGMLEDEVSAVLEYKPGKFILGHNTGFTFFDYHSRQFDKLPFPYTPGFNLLRRVLEMQRDRKGNIWAALGPAGLARIDPQRRIALFTPSSGAPYNTTGVWVDAGDNIWLSSEQGFFVKSGELFLPVTLGPDPQPALRKIFGEAGGERRVRYLAGMGTGVYIYEDETKQWKNFQAPGDIRANGVYAIYKDSRNRLLVGTLAGLYTVEKDVLKKFEEKGFELSHPVYFILEDREKRLWLGTDDGVVRWDGSRVQRYSISDGLIGQETNRSAGIMDSSGKLWIGTNRGLSIYEEIPDYYIGRNPPPKLYLLNLESDGRNIPLLQPVKLTDSTHDLVFHFRGISFLDEKEVRFKEKLEGFNETWSEEHYPYKQMIRYANLPAGRYRFHLVARNVLGVWSDPVVSPWITIPRPFYRQWWFILLEIIAAAFVFYSFVSYISQKRNAALLEKQVIERTGQLAASEKRYRTLFEESRDMIFTTTKEGRFADINPAGVALLGYASLEEALKIDIRSGFYYSWADRDALYKELKKRGYLRDFEIAIRRKDGEKIAVMVTAVPVP
ncbi:MAG: Response regulator, partial [Acidobacteriota bacterium]|nr:Response regulator [Acidobacteriota bacterium]